MKKIVRIEWIINEIVETARGRAVVFCLCSVITYLLTVRYTNGFETEACFKMIS